jgi:hypothetical protein
VSDPDLIEGQARWIATEPVTPPPDPETSPKTEVEPAPEQEVHAGGYDPRLYDPNPFAPQPVPARLNAGIWRDPRLDTS